MARRDDRAEHYRRDAQKEDDEVRRPRAQLESAHLHLADEVGPVAECDGVEIVPVKRRRMRDRHAKRAERVAAREVDLLEMAD